MTTRSIQAVLSQLGVIAARSEGPRSVDLVTMSADVGALLSRKGFHELVLRGDTVLYREEHGS